MGATGPDLLGVENDAAEAMGERAVESDVGAEHDVDPVARQPVARQRAIDAEAAQVVAQVTRRVEKQQRVDVARRLHDA